ncbi:MAG: TetR/AcrR family transcriptional regulator [Treponema sp.]|nr:TetR/AcrR family transcriptional regulator [Treponema sp.]
MLDFDTGDTKENIFNAAKKEFLEKGYKDASLRHICSEAGVTTGALYFFFKNKEDILDKILEPLIDGYRKMVRNLFKGNDAEKKSWSGESQLIEYLYQNREAAIILIKCRHGTKYEEIFESIYNGMKYGFKSLFRTNGINDVDDSFLDILASMKMEGYLNMLKGDYTLEEIQDLAEKITAYWDSGFFGLVEKMKGKF